METVDPIHFKAFTVMACSFGGLLVALVGVFIGRLWPQKREITSQLEVRTVENVTARADFNEHVRQDQEEHARLYDAYQEADRKLHERVNRVGEILAGLSSAVEIHARNADSRAARVEQDLRDCKIFHKS